MYQDQHERDRRFTLHYGDLTDATNMIELIQRLQPDEIYNLGAQSHVKVSFDLPEYTAQTNALGALRVLEAIRILGLTGKTRYYQAGTSEMYGGKTAMPQSETTPFQPRSPYAVAKLYAFWTTVNYRTTYGIHASNGILVNHESPARGETFVTRKITRAVAAIHSGRQECLYLGNLDARRDWGHARDYVAGMWLMLQHDTPDDYVLATGQSHTVRTFASLAFARIGINLIWHGHGVKEVGTDAATGKALVYVDPSYFRANEVDFLMGDASKARTVLGWRPQTSFPDLVAEMVNADIAALA